MNFALIRFPSAASAVLAAAALLITQSAHAADPTTADCLTASEKAIQLRGQNHFRAARSELLVCAAETCPADVRNECVRRVGDLNAAMPTIVFEAKDGAGRDLADVKISMDGEPLADRLTGSALSIDPGEHSFELETAGYPPARKQLVISEGVKGRRELIVFGGSQPSGSESAAGDASSAGSTQRIIGWSVAGAGVVGLALGTVFTLQRASKLDTRDAICPSGTGCTLADQERIDQLTNEAQTASTLSLVSFVAGGALVAGGLVLVFTAPRGRASADRAAKRVAILPIILPEFQGAMVSGHVW